jgi:hypothetical protein
MACPNNNYITHRSTSDLTVGHIFRAHWDDYCRNHQVTPDQARVAGAIMACRTPRLGGRIDQCDQCGAMVFRYKSCRDRHCNQCQKFERAKWVEKQKVIQLPIPYFHVVFTTDHALNPLFRQNKQLMYDLLFQTMNEVLQEQVGAALGCQLGITAVLHTWGQTMQEHIHLHTIVTGGGLSRDGQRWIKSKTRRYLVNVIELSAAYRDRLLDGIERLYQEGQLTLSGSAAELDVPAMLAKLRAKDWEVFIRPFEDSEQVTDYLSRYVHQVAISNHRLVKFEKGQVTFRYYDNRERAEVGGKGKEKLMTLKAEEFIRRFLLHVLPPRYIRIRYYGLHHSSARKEKLPRCRALLGLEPALPEPKELSLLDWLEEVLGEEEVDRCPYCGAKASLFKRAEFDKLPWLVALLVSLVSQPTRQGVCR